MKNRFKLLMLICIVFAACNSTADKNEELIDETVLDSFATGTTSDSAHTISNRPLIWSVATEDSGTEKLIKPENVNLDTYSSAQLVDMLNKNFPDVHLDFEKISHDTMYVKIPDSRKLTQEMGSTGAENYLASATYTLTELKDIKYINFDLKEGDHAGPGVFSRENFKSLR